jgi:hypothetical protein
MPVQVMTVYGNYESTVHSTSQSRLSPTRISDHFTTFPEVTGPFEMMSDD